MTGDAPRKVLVVEDESALRAVIAEYLAHHGFEVLQAENGLEALLHVKRHRPQSIVLDLNMPRLGGIETLKHVQSFDPSIDVVVVTAVADPEARRQALARGARAVLAKPVTLKELVDVLTGAPPPDPS